VQSIPNSAVFRGGKLCMQRSGVAPARKCGGGSKIPRRIRPFFRLILSYGARRHNREVDRELIEACQRGDHDAFAAPVRRPSRPRLLHRPALFRHPSVALDIAQAHLPQTAVRKSASSVVKPSSNRGYTAWCQQLPRSPARRRKWVPLATLRASATVLSVCCAAKWKKVSSS